MHYVHVSELRISLLGGYLIFIMNAHVFGGTQLVRVSVINPQTFKHCCSQVFHVY